MLDRLHTLAPRMTVVLDRPHRAEDFFAVLKAMSYLEMCCAIEIRYLHVGTPWRAVLCWVCELEEDFISLLAQANAAALVVWAHFVALLVRPAEDAGCWWLHGAATKMMQSVIVELGSSTNSVLSLVEGLL